MKLELKLERYYKDHLYRNSIMLMMNLGTNALAGFFFWIIAARVISSNDVGLSTAALSLATLIIGLSGLGMSTGMIRFLPQVEDKRTLYSSILIVNLVLSSILTIIILVLIQFLFPSLGFLNNGTFPLIFILFVLINATLSIQNVTFTALRRADLSFAQNVFCVLRIPIIYLLAFTGVVSIFYALTIAYSVAIIFGVIMLYLSGISFSFKFDINSIKNILTYSLGNYTAELFVSAPSTIIPIIIINTIGATNNAYFYIAYSISSFLFIIPNGISTSLFVEGSHNLPLKATTIRAVKLLILIMIPSLVIIFLFGDYILMIFNVEYALKSFELLKLLAFSSIFSSFISIYVSILRVNKNIKMVNTLYLLYSASIILLGYVGIMYYGLIGLGYAWILSSLFICIIIAYDVFENYVKSAYHGLVQS